MSEDFFKFPSTPYLVAPSGVDIRGDKVLDGCGREAFLRRGLVVEEKVDGANLGISFSADGDVRVQNRGTVLRLPEPGQWKKLQQWLTPRIDLLFEHLSDRYILFGEWCYAQHSVPYNRLPDWFLGFDLYDRQARKFLSVDLRNSIFKEIKVAQVPEIARGKFTYSEIQTLLRQSELGDHSAEGIYLRADQDGWLIQRAKLVRPAFVQSIKQHWSRSPIKPNRCSV